MTTVTSFATAVDVTLAELKLEAFLPADPATAEALSRAAKELSRAPEELSRSSEALSRPSEPLFQAAEEASHPAARPRVREQHAAGEAGDLLGGR